jgi:hypothetical protein
MDNTNIAPEKTNIKEIPIVISITSEQAFRKLIAGDPELELTIKSTIAKNIAKSFDKMLVAYNEKIINSVCVSDVLGRVQEEFSSHYITTEVTRKNGFDQKVKVLRPEIRDMIANVAMGVLNDAVRSEVDKLRDDIERRLEAEKARLYARVQSGYDKMDEVVSEFEEAVMKDVTSDVIKAEVSAKVVKQLDAIRNGL